MMKLNCYFLHILKQKGGFTLIELMIAIVIVSIVVIPICGTIINTLNILNRLDYKVQAFYTGQKIIEKIKALNCTDFIEDGSAIKEYQDKFDIEIKKDKFDNSKIIELNISWRKNESINLTTIIKPD